MEDSTNWQKTTEDVEDGESPMSFEKDSSKVDDELQVASGEKDSNIEEGPEIAQRFHIGMIIHWH